MKRSIAALAITLSITALVYAQVPALDSFESAFKGFASDMAGSLSVDSTIGSNWSDAYIGSFPRFGAGITMGAAFIDASSAKKLFEAMDASLPSEFTSLGVPIPTVVGVFKIGLPFIPLDIGIKGGYISPAVGRDLKSATNVSADYTNLGIQLRYALLKQNIVMPNVSVGVAYNYQKGNLSAPSGLGSQSFDVTTDQGTTTISATDPDVALGWTSNTVDFTAQVSKKFLFIVPYLGTGFTVGKSTVKGGVSSKLDSTYNSSTYGSGISGLNSFFAANGGPSITDQGFSYSADCTDPTFRLYGGFSIRLFILDFDTQAIYLPSTKSFGASLTTRIQL
jgi:hypothetical protein